MQKRGIFLMKPHSKIEFRLSGLDLILVKHRTGKDKWLLLSPF